MSRNEDNNLGETERQRFLSSIRKAAEEFAAGAPLSVPPDEQKRAIDRVGVSFRALAAKNPTLYSATAQSIGRAIALSALTGLVPGGPLPQVDLIPRRRKVKPTDPNHRGRWPEVVEIDWQIGWRGYLELAARAGCRAKAVAVYDGESFVWEEGLEDRLVHRPDPAVEGWGTWDALVGVYVVARLRDGSRDFVMVPRSLLEERRARSESWRNVEKWDEAQASGKPLTFDDGNPRPRPDSPWSDWPIEMAQKTALRYAASRGLLAFDELGKLAFGEDQRGDVIEAEAPARVTGRKVEAMPPEPAALPDYDPLGLDQEEEREPVKERVRVDPSVRDGAQEPPPFDPTPGPTPPPPDPNRFAKADAEKLREKLGAWKVPLTMDQVRAALLGALGLSRLKPEDRHERAVQFGIDAYGWRLVNDRLLPAVEVSDG